MIIGFAGKKGSGKDTAGAHLVDKHGFTRISFADKLKESAAACFGIDPSLWELLKNDPDVEIDIRAPFGQYESTVTLASVTVREFLQLYGTEAHRDIFGTDFWVEAAIAPLRENTGGRYVFTDARFDNEAIAIHRLGGSVIEVVRGQSGTEDNHSSETGITESLIDGKIRNIGSIDQLNTLLDALVARVALGD